MSCFLFRVAQLTKRPHYVGMTARGHLHDVNRFVQRAVVVLERSVQNHRGMVLKEEN